MLIYKTWKISLIWKLYIMKYNKNLSWIITIEKVNNTSIIITEKIKSKLFFIFLK